MNDILERANQRASDWNNRRPVRIDSGMGLSPQELFAKRNNEAFKASNGSYPECPYGPHGRYSTGKR